ncbi:hypothetical protein B566_EDAN003711 [Ephemera danica]|nr:hypothetical protein B566_EDAN003711 [Ephemera danica]
MKKRQEEEEQRRQEALAAKQTPVVSSPDEVPTDRVDGERSPEGDHAVNGEKEGGAEAQEAHGHANGAEVTERRRPPALPPTGPRPTSRKSATSPPATPLASSTPPTTPTSSKKKDRARSKSPFRSFRWKKAKSPVAASASMPGSASDDESNLERAAERPGTGDGDLFEGMLVRKHEWENTTKKASNRSWDKLFVVVRGGQIYFYKDQKTAKSTPESYFKGEGPVDVRGGSCEIASDYTKKKHVFRVKMVGGAEFLFQARDDEELATWVQQVSSQCDAEGATGGPSRSQTLPASGDRKDEPKRRSFFTLKKK